jgi:hypothetical protein
MISAMKVEIDWFKSIELTLWALGYECVSVFKLGQLGLGRVDQVDPKPSQLGLLFDSGTLNPAKQTIKRPPPPSICLTPLSLSICEHLEFWSNIEELVI